MNEQVRVQREEHSALNTGCQTRDFSSVAPSLEPRGHHVCPREITANTFHLF